VYALWLQCDTWESVVIAGDYSSLGMLPTALKVAGKEASVIKRHTHFFIDSWGTLFDD